MLRSMLCCAFVTAYGLTETPSASGQVWVRGGGISINAPGFSFSYGYPGWYSRNFVYPYAGWYGPGYGYYPYYGAYYSSPAWRSYYPMAAPGVYGPGVWPPRPAYHGLTTPEGRPSQSVVNSAASTSPGGSQLVTTELRIQLPDPNAQLTINGQPTTQRGTERVFSVPPLEQGRVYSYTLRATWVDSEGQVTREKRFDFKPGEPLSVTFTSTAEPSPN